VKKIKKNQIIITAFAIMIAIAGYINYTGSLSDIISVQDVANTNVVNEDLEDEKLASNEVDESALEQSLTEPGSAVLTSSNAINTAIVSEAKLGREQIRAKNKESLLEIVNNASLSDAAKADAVNKLANITENSEKEIAAELLLEAKGFQDVVVSVMNDSVDVVVGKATLTDSERAQIEDIVKRKTQMSADKITINVCNPQ